MAYKRRVKQKTEHRCKQYYYMVYEDFRMQGLQFWIPHWPCRAFNAATNTSKKLIKSRDTILPWYWVFNWNDSNKVNNKMNAYSFMFTVVPVIHSLHKVRTSNAQLAVVSSIRMFRPWNYKTDFKRVLHYGCKRKAAARI